MRGCVEWIGWGVVIWVSEESGANSTSSIRARISKRAPKMSLMV